jgi:S-adenosylmethionine decarboxylase
MEAKIYNRRWWISCCDSALIKTSLQDNLVLSGFTVLNFVEHQFQPQGYTCLWLLAESHAAVHTFPEEAKSYIELSSCAESLLLSFDRNLQQIAQANAWQITV